MRCPICKKMYDDQALRYCLDDGAPLHPTHSKVDQDAPTLVTEADDLDARRPYRKSNLEGRCKVTLEATLRFIGRQPITERGIIELAPRFMTDEQVRKAIAALIEDGFLNLVSFPDISKLQMYWWDVEKMNED
jgi:hypothetical protein